MTAMQR